MLYRVIEEDCTADQALYENNELQSAYQEIIRCILTKIADEGRIKVSAGNAKFVKE